jgi:hypothetical protein
VVHASPSSQVGLPGLGVQTPTEPARLHDQHWPPHASLQQTPLLWPDGLTQAPLAHWVSDVHVIPVDGS